MSDDTNTSDDDDLDDTLNRQMSTSGMTGVVQKLKQQTGDKAAGTDQPEEDDS